MGMPVEDAAQEVVENDSMLNIHKGRVAAWKALMKYITEGVPGVDGLYVPDISMDDQRLDDVSLQSFNSMRNAWTAMYTHWKYPDLYVNVQCDRGSIYTRITKSMTRSSDHSQATLF
jgi:hypothetical protein